jgi:hypothetical protein
MTHLLSPMQGDTTKIIIRITIPQFIICLLIYLLGLSFLYVYYKKHYVIFKSTINMGMHTVENRKYSIKADINIYVNNESSDSDSLFISFEREDKYTYRTKITPKKATHIAHIFQSIKQWYTTNKKAIKIKNNTIENISEDQQEKILKILENTALFYGIYRNIVKEYKHTRKLYELLMHYSRQYVHNDYITFGNENEKLNAEKFNKDKLPAILKEFKIENADKIRIDNHNDIYDRYKKHRSQHVEIARDVLYIYIDMYIKYIYGI